MFFSFILFSLFLYNTHREIVLYQLFKCFNSKNLFNNRIDNNKFLTNCHKNNFNNQLTDTSYLTDISLTNK